MLNYDQRIIAFQGLVNVATESFPCDIDLIIDYLKKLGYFNAPASTKFHLSEDGGLFEHSLNVTYSLLELTKNNRLKWQNKDSCIIIGLFHDLCKSDSYVRNIITDSYSWNDKQRVFGHGDKSIKYLEEMQERGLIRELTGEERFCIRWHMGAFEGKEMWNNFTDAIHQYPNVLWTHTADMIATHIKEV